jgi:hypothetical protein
MGEKLIMYYKYVGDLKGFMGKVELAKLTLMPTTIAAAAPDSPEHIQKFREAVEKITKKESPSY